MASRNIKLAMRLTLREIDYLKDLAERQKSTVSAEIRAMVDRFLARGSRVHAEDTKLIAINIDREVLADAQAKAAENGVTLRDIIRHEIGMIYERP